MSIPTPPLTTLQQQIHARCMSTPMNQWPESLQAYVASRVRIVGFCGQVLHDAVAEWVVWVERVPFESVPKSAQGAPPLADTRAARLRDAPQCHVCESFNGYRYGGEVGTPYEGGVGWHCNDCDAELFIGAAPKKDPS